MTETAAKILVIEDEASLSNILSETLADRGYKVSIAIQGEEGWQKTKDERPDLVLLDIVLPRLDGFVYLKRLRAHKKLKDIPVLILSNLGQDSDVEQGRQLGAIDYMVKSNHTIDAIIKRVEGVLSESKQQSE